ncbi:MAG: DUF4276 family protein [Acidobacteria bacterium]|nr:DUF4276 family protein [Acidobacteriota bacterium]
MPVRVACLVEGHGETTAVPILLRRVLADIEPGFAVEIPHPIRMPRSKLVKAGELERAVELAARQVAPDGAILILLDADDDCPAQLGAALKERAVRARGDIPISVVLAKREFEAWYIAAAGSLGLLADPAGAQPADPEAIAGAKEWIQKRMPRRKYSETVDQPALAAILNLEEARRCPSFDKLYRDMTEWMKMWRLRGAHAEDGGTPGLDEIGR